MKDFVGRLQKDLAHLQKTLKQEGDDLVKKLRTATTSKNLKATGRQIEKMVEQRLKKIEPQMNRVLSDLRKNAKKAGLDLDAIEKNVRARLGVKAPAKSKKKTTAKARKAPASKRPATKRAQAQTTTHEPSVN
ncbi:hypothetical protein EBZ80_05985 [bacterium]|nr:hypothetical protein [bacterium]